MQSWRFVMAAEPTEKRARAFDILLSATRLRGDSSRRNAIVHHGDANVMIEPSRITDSIMLVILNGFELGVGSDIRFVATCDNEHNTVEVCPYRPWKSDGPMYFQCPTSPSATMRAILDICTQDLKWMREHHGKALRPGKKVLADMRSALRRMGAIQ